MKDRSGNSLPHFTPGASQGSSGVNLFAQDLTHMVALCNAHMFSRLCSWSAQSCDSYGRQLSAHARKYPPLFHFIFSFSSFKAFTRFSAWLNLTTKTLNEKHSETVRHQAKGGMLPQTATQSGDGKPCLTSLWEFYGPRKSFLCCRVDSKNWVVCNEYLASPVSMHFSDFPRVYFTSYLTPSKRNMSFKCNV